MRLLYKKLDFEINFVENQVEVLVIENKEVFRDFINSFISELNGLDGNIILSNDNKEINIAKNIEFIINPYGVDINNKKILSKLFSEIEYDLNTYYIDDMVELNQHIVELLDKSIDNIPYDLVYNPMLNYSGLLKFMDVKNRDVDIDLLDKLINYIKLVHSLLKIDLFIFVNLKTFLTDDELVGLYEIADYEKINLLLIESYQKEDLKNERIWIIDKDRCIIN